MFDFFSKKDNSKSDKEKDSLNDKEKKTEKTEQNSSFGDKIISALDVAFNSLMEKMFGPFDKITEKACDTVISRYLEEHPKAKFLGGKFIVKRVSEDKADASVDLYFQDSETNDFYKMSSCFKQKNIDDFSKEFQEMLNEKSELTLDITAPK